ncbi:uncharacterized protein [Henckelia pumila]|uniref:uncharacterized protein n=1 Tax=Henckelia pumila TaxID=405737 RepID=UPI003C6E33F1
MSRARDIKNLVPLDLEIESTLCCIRSAQRQNNLALDFESEEEFEDMAEDENNRTLMELYRPMIQLQVRFGGVLYEDPNAHLEQFLSICDTFKFNGVTTDAIRLRLFPFSLKGEAIEQKDEESLNATWTRFKNMLRVCSVHGLSVGQQVETFYYGVDSSARSMLNAAANDSLYRKTPMAESNVDWQDNRREKKVGFLEMNALTAITAKLDGLTHQVSQLQVNKSAPLKQVNQVQLQGNTEVIGEPESNVPFMPDVFFEGIPVFERDSVNYVGNQEQYNPFSFSYNPGWKNHPNFRWNQAKNLVEPQCFNPPQQPTLQRPCSDPHQALAQMPSYAKFLKEILSNKRKLVEFETIKLSKECYAILQNKLPPKLKDPGSFSIPCTIGNSFFSKALCDLDARINLMPYSCFEKLGIVDFVVLDMKEDREIFLILGRPFLATGKTLIDVQKGELVLRLNDESVAFNVFLSMKHPSNISNCVRIDATDGFVECDVQEFICEDPLEYLDVGKPLSRTVNSRIGELGHVPRALKSSIEETPILEMKPLPSHLKYLFLVDNDKLPIIISSTLTGDDE